MQELYRNGPKGNQAGRVAYRMTVQLNADAPAGRSKAN